MRRQRGLCISLLLTASMASLSGAKAADSAPEGNQGDRIFLEQFLNWFQHASTGRMRVIMDKPAERLAVKKEMEGMTIEQKCRLAILMWFSLPLDGETAETFGDFFGRDRPEMARRLRSINDKELLNLCSRMGFPNGKIEGFKHKLKVWEKGEQELAAAGKTILPRPVNRLVKEEGGILSFENTTNRSITVMQFQLRGTIHNVCREGDGMAFQFKGRVELRTTGVDIFNPHGRLRTDCWNVVDLHVGISKWSEDGPPWAGNSLSFQEAFERAADLSNRGRVVKAALKEIKLTFGGTGDLLRVDGEQVVFQEELAK